MENEKEKKGRRIRERKRDKIRELKRDREKYRSRKEKSHWIRECKSWREVLGKRIREREREKCDKNRKRKKQGVKKIREWKRKRDEEIGEIIKRKWKIVSVGKQWLGLYLSPQLNTGWIYTWAQR